VDSSILFYFFIYFFVFVHGLQLAHFQFLALCQPIFKKTVKKEEEKKKKKKAKKKRIRRCAYIFQLQAQVSIRQSSPPASCHSQASCLL